MGLAWESLDERGNGITSERQRPDFGLGWRKRLAGIPVPPRVLRQWRDAAEHRFEPRLDPDTRDAELGFWLLPSARGHGIAARAIVLTVGWAFELGLERVHGLTDIDNRAAQRVMEKAGFVREGVLRGLERRPTGRVDFVSYSVLHTDEAAG